VSGAADAVAAPGLLDRARVFGWRHPEWWAVLASVLAWGYLASAAHGHAGHGTGRAAMGAMVVAMMLPLTIAQLRHVALSSLWRRRHRAIAGFTVGFVAVWMVVEAVLAVAWRGVATLAGATVAAGGVAAAAALWELAPFRRRHLRRCHRTVPLAPSGWRADADCARFGAAIGVSCVGTCWALMLASAAFAHSIPVMLALFGVQLSGRYWKRHSPGLAAAAVLAALVVLG
jgi:predicted metal-binding membrane protein